MSDGITYEQANEVKDSTYWTFIKKELQYRIELKTNELRKCKSQGDLDKINEAINTLESVMRIPEDVIDRETS